MSLEKIQEVMLGKKEEKRKPIPPRTRKEVLTRPRKCMWCRKHPAQEIHHIDENPRNNKRDNLIPLCGFCHNRVTSGEITKQQLWKRLGIKKKVKKVAKREFAQRKRPKAPWERIQDIIS